MPSDRARGGLGGGPLGPSVPPSADAAEVRPDPRRPRERGRGEKGRFPRGREAVAATVSVRLRERPFPSRRTRPGAALGWCRHPSSAPRPPPSGPARAEAESRAPRRAPGTRAPAVTRGTPRRLPPPRAHAPGPRPRRVSRSEPAVGLGGGWGPACVWRAGAVGAVRRPPPTPPLPERPPPPHSPPPPGGRAAVVLGPSGSGRGRPRRRPVLPSAAASSARVLSPRVLPSPPRGLCSRARAPAARAAAGVGSPCSSRRPPPPPPPPRPPRPSETRPQIRRGDPLNLSILVSGGKETNQDSLSNGE